MRKRLDKFCLMIAAVVVFGLAFLVTGCLAQSQHQPSSKPEDSLKRFVQNYVGSTADDKTTKYFPAFVDLRDDGTQEAIVYLTEDSWCGSGGCTVLILAPANASYKLVTKITIAQLPIRVLETKSHGWHDIAVWVQGGGIQPGYDAKLSFNGNTYPKNPTVPPAQPLKDKVPGQVVVSEASEGKPLF